MSIYLKAQNARAVRYNLQFLYNHILFYNGMSMGQLDILSRSRMHNVRGDVACHFEIDFLK